MNDTEKFTGYFRDQATGLDYADQRYHQPGVGRFMTPDPYKASIGPSDPGSWNRYAFVEGDPINDVDPTGEYALALPTPTPLYFGGVTNQGVQNQTAFFGDGYLPAIDWSAINTYLTQYWANEAMNKILQYQLANYINNLSSQCASALTADGINLGALAAQATSTTYYNTTNYEGTWTLQAVTGYKGYGPNTTLSQALGEGVAAVLPGGPRMYEVGKTIFTIITLAITLLLTTSEAQIVYNKNGLGVSDRGLVVPQTEFNLSKIRRLARDYLERDAKDAKIARLLMASDEESVSKNLIHGGLPWGAVTAADIARIEVPRGPMARLLSISGRAKLSYSENGNLTEEYLSGPSDPTMFRIGPDDFELLHFYLSVPTRTSPGASDLNFYLRTTPRMSISSCIELFTRLRRLTSAKMVTMNVRPDPWFMDQSRYPGVLPFVKPQPIPSDFHLSISPSVQCITQEEGIVCSGRNFSP